MKKVLYTFLLGFFVVVPSLAFADVQCAANIQTRNGNIEWGKSTTYTNLAQPFTVSSSCTLKAIGILAQIEGSPTDHATVAVYSDSASAPNTVIETGTNIDPAVSWAMATSTFAGTTVLNSGTTYWVVLGRTGATSDTNRYDMGVSNTSPAFGTINKKAGGGWSTEAAGFNFVFAVVQASPATPSISSGATSTVEQAQANLSYAFSLFFVCFFGVVWLLSRKK